MKIFVTFLVSLMIASFAHADAIGIWCSKDPMNPKSKDIGGMGADELEPKDMETASADYRGKKFSKHAEIFVIKDHNKKIVRYIVKEGSLTLVFSHLAKCGDEMNTIDDYATLTVSKTIRSETKVVEKVSCNCDID